MKPARNPIVIYQANDGAISLKGDVAHDTIWATQEQIANIFNLERSVVTKHIRNIFKDKELNQNSVCAKFAHTASDGKSYQVNFYNLDIILAIGYRASSKRAIEFRQWATKTLRQHITKGFTINRRQIAKNYEAFMKSVGDIQKLLPEHITLDPKAILELIKEFAGTWVSLNAYDKETLATVGSTKKSVKLTGAELLGAINNLRTQLIKDKEATEIFAQERVVGSIEGIVGNVMQSFGGQSVYATVEEKAAHLLYFMVKNHPFVDGNKRSGALSFIWFLKKTGAKTAHRINPAALTALTLLIAESLPAKKEQMIALVIQVLK